LPFLSGAGERVRVSTIPSTGVGASGFLPLGWRNGGLHAWLRVRRLAEVSFKIKLEVNFKSISPRASRLQAAAVLAVTWIARVV